MPPLFPGMDPFLETSGFWPAFHDGFVAYLREVLQPLLPRGYYAEIRTCDEVGLVGFQAERVILPDVAVNKTQVGALHESPPVSGANPGGGTRPDVLTIEEDPSLKVNSLEIRDFSRGDQLVTLLEVLSPSNKQPGPDREAFERRQEEVLSSDANWIEVDLLHEGKRIACHPAVGVHCRRKSYLQTVVVSRSSRRALERPAVGGWH